MKSLFRFSSLCVVSLVLVISMALSFAMAAEKPKSPAPTATKAPQAITPTAPIIMSQRKQVVLEVTDRIAAAGGKVELRGKVKAKDGTPVKAGDVYFKINGEPVPSLVMMGIAYNVPFYDSDPVLKISCDMDKYKLHMGANTIEMEFKGNDEYAPAKGTGRLSIIKAATNLNISQLFDLTYDNKNPKKNHLQVKGGLTTIEGGLVKGRAVVLEINGKKVATLATGEDSGFEYIHKFTDADRGKKIKVHASFEGDARYLAAAGDGERMLSAAPVVPSDVNYFFSEAPQLPVMFGQDVKVVAQLMSSPVGSGIPATAPYSTKSVCLKNMDCATTDASGKAIFKFKIDKQSSQALLIDDSDDWSPNKFHNMIPASIMVLPTPSSLTIVSSPAAASIGDKIKVRAKLVASGKPAPSRIVTIAVGGTQVGYGGTDSNGEALLSIDVTSAQGIGTKKMVVKFTPDTTNNKTDSLIGSSVERNIQINPKTN